MKKLSIKTALLSFVALGLVLASCNTTIEVAKRKHRKGYHVSINKNNKENFVVQQDVAETVELANVDSPAVDTATVKTSVVAPKTEEKKVVEKSENEATVLTQENNNSVTKKKEKLTFVQKVKAVKQVRKQLKELKQSGALDGSDDIDSDVMFILLLILAIILPPATVFWIKGKESNAFKLNLILWLIGLLGLGISIGTGINLAWLAMVIAIIHAVLVLLGNS